jgi:hypothetical protein
MKIVIELLVYLLSLYFAYRLYKKFSDRLEKYVNEVTEKWPNIPYWLNCILGISLLIGSIVMQLTMFFVSVTVWLVLLIIIPFFFLPITNRKIFNFLSVTTFLLTSFFAITLFFNVNNSRDIIGEAFIPNYKVFYTTEIVRVDYGTGYEEKEKEIPHIYTGDNTLNYFLESIFPFVYRILLGIIIILSLMLNISIREKNKLITNHLQ